MSENFHHEREKWERYFSELGFFGDEDHVQRFNQEFVQVISDLLPTGGHVLEAGCGGGLQSLSLARTGKFEVSLMDFSHEALNYARGLFDREHISAQFLFGDVFVQSQTRDYDLVFNSGVLEHYSFADQVRFLQGMASRSRRYVLVLVPNRLCYWYWIWRVQTTERGEWPFGREVPRVDLSSAFKEAGLHFIGQCFLGEAWTESFILDLKGIDESLRTTLLTVHRSALIPKSQKSYLLAALGSVAPQQGKISPTWQSEVAPEDFEQSQIIDDISRIIAESSRAAQEAVSLQQEKLLQEIKDLNSRNQKLVVDLFSTRNVLDEIYKSHAWQLIKLLWKIRLAVAPPLSLRARALGRVFRGVGHFVRLMRKITFRQNLYSYAFDRYKSLRNRIYPPNLHRLRCPSESGLVSIILPVYNGAAMLREALDSILSQSYKNLEIIVVDDGSTDETPAILAEYAQKDERIQVIHQENAKLPRALSRGFAQAHGEFLTWTSHDNRLKPDFVMTLVTDLRAHPCYDMVYANKDIIDDAGQPLRNSEWYRGYQRPMGSEHIYLPLDTSELNTYANNSIGGAFMYRDRVAWLLGDYSPIRFTTEDYDYWMRVNALLTLKHSTKKRPIYEYRFHSQSLTSRDKELRITQDRNRLMVFEEFRRDFYLTPAVWFVESEQPSLLERQPVRELQKKVQDASHLILDRSRFSSEILPPLWMPCVYLHVTDRPEAASAPPDDLPLGALKVLLSLNAQDLPARMDLGWDLCFTVGKDHQLPRLEGKFQGWLSAGTTRELFTAIDIRARSDHLRKIEDLLEKSSQHSLKASVIICTYKRPDFLLKALDSVAHQTLPQSGYEIIVVNNDVNDHSLKEQIDLFRTQKFSDFPDHLRYLVCPIPGLSHARNAGISIAAGEILCFLDDDAVTGPDWLEKICSAFELHPEAGLIGGHIRLVSPDPKPEALRPGWEKYWGNFETEHTSYTEVENWWDYPWGGNWCARHQAMIEIGGFRGRYGRTKKDFAGGEEIVAAALLQQLGYKIAILPEAEVKHIPSVDRFTLEYVRRTIFAGLFTIYRQQQDLYIPYTFTVSFSLKSILKLAMRWIRLATSREKDEQQFFETRARLYAHIRLFGQQLVDSVSRFRRPVTRRRTCWRIAKLFFL